MPGRRLVLMRHATAESHADTDAQRNLTPAGRRQAAAAGDGLRAAELRFDAALVSSASRTRQTWELLAERIEDPPEPEILDELYDTTAHNALALLTRVDPDVSTLLVVCHEPVISSLALLLAGPGSDHLHEVRAGVPTATRCVLTVPTAWADLAPRGAVLSDVERTPAD